MPALLIYLLKANIALALFFLAYRWGLRRLTFYVLNRFFLLTGIVCSSVFPLVDVNALLQRHREIGEVAAYVPDLGLLQAQPDTGLTIWHLLVYIFWTGVAVMSIRFCIQLLSLWQLHRKTRAGQLEQQQVRMLNDKVTPFSFFRHIYINPSLHQPSELEAILQHELVHVKEWHTLDVLMAELNNIFYWFNPGAWLMKTAIRENLEFITDRRMLQQGVDPKAYQYNLIKVNGIPYATAIANNFNFSHLKNRIKMMNKKSSAKYNLLRYLVLGCVVVIALLSLNFSRAAFNAHRDAAVNDTVPPPPAPLSPEIPVPPPPPEKEGLTAVAVPPAPPAPIITSMPAAPPPPPAPVKRKVAPPPPPKPPKPVMDTLPAPTITVDDPRKPPLYVVDGVKRGLARPADIKADDIQSINVWKGEHAIQRYGSEGTNGVVEIYTKKGGMINSEDKNVKGKKIKGYTILGYQKDTVKIKKSSSLKGGKKVKVNAGVKTVTSVNSKVNVQVNDNTNVNTNTNTNVDVKPKITTTIKGVDSTHEPIVIIDGTVTTMSGLNAIPGERIATINVLKNAAATKYGKKGVANGVIEVRTRGN